VSIPEADLADLRRRISATRLPEKETVTDCSQGVPLATVEKLAKYWATEYDWRKVEARLNEVPNFITEIPVAASAFPDELFQTPRSWAEQAYPKLVHYNKLPKGGHFAA
jgi:hypothetical protein